jgi:hypothetical protein
MSDNMRLPRPRCKTLCIDIDFVILERRIRARLHP